jgi:hypothetical protein
MRTLEGNVKKVVAIIKKAQALGEVELSAFDVGYLAGMVGESKRDIYPEELKDECEKRAKIARGELDEAVKSATDLGFGVGLRSIPVTLKNMFYGFIAFRFDFRENEDTFREILDN